MPQLLLPTHLHMEVRGNFQSGLLAVKVGVSPLNQNGSINLSWFSAMGLKISALIFHISLFNVFTDDFLMN